MKFPPLDLSKFNAMNFKEVNKGKPFKASIEPVRDGSTVRAYLLPGYQPIQVFVARIQAPSIGRRTVVDTCSQSEVAKTYVLAKQCTASLDTLTTSIYIAPDLFAREAKHFTEIHVLHRDVHIVIDGVDKFNNPIGSIVYADGDTTKDLRLELVKNVVEVVSGDCIIVEDLGAVNGSKNSERRVNLSSIRCPKMGNPRKGNKPDEPFAREAKEFLRKSLIGQQISWSLTHASPNNITAGQLQFYAKRCI